MKKKHTVNFCAKNNTIYPLTMNNRLYGPTAYSSVQHQYHIGGGDHIVPNFTNIINTEGFYMLFKKRSRKHKKL
jgi:hypothetical protein